MLIYLAVEDLDGEGEGEGGFKGEGGCTERVLTPWAGAACDAERPVALVHGGDNCLLLAPFEGTSLCEAEDAEKAKARAERFGLPVAESARQSAEDAEKAKKRAERFGTAPAPIDPEEEERRKKRQARFDAMNK
jgi:hypothetical protein